MAVSIDRWNRLVELDCFDRFLPFQQSTNDAMHAAHHPFVIAEDDWIGRVVPIVPDARPRQNLGGNILTSDFGHGFDTVLLFNVIHGFDETENRRVLDRARRALELGGGLLVVDQFQAGFPDV